MFDDDVQTPISVTASDRYYKVAKFPTRNIKTPIVLIYGGSDSLVDIHVMLKELPRHTVVREIPHFEHLDFLWAQQVDSLVFPHIFEALDSHTGCDHLQRAWPTFVDHSGSAGGDIVHFEPDDPIEASYRITDMRSTLGDLTCSKCRSPPNAQQQGHSLPHSPSSTGYVSLSGDDMDDSKQPELRWKTSAKHTRKRSGSTSSHRNFDGIGINVGASHVIPGTVDSPVLYQRTQKLSGTRLQKAS